MTTNSEAIVLTTTAAVTEMRKLVVRTLREGFDIITYLNMEVICQRSTGYINAAAILLTISKVVARKKCNMDAWLARSNSWPEINEMAHSFGMAGKDMLHTLSSKEVGNALQGTYVHPYLLPSIIGWASLEYKIKIVKLIQEYNERRARELIHGLETDNARLFRELREMREIAEHARNEAGKASSDITDQIVSSAALLKSQLCEANSKLDATNAQLRDAKDRHAAELIDMATKFAELQTRLTEANRALAKASEERAAESHLAADRHTEVVHRLEVAQDSLTHIEESTQEYSSRAVMAPSVSELTPVFYITRIDAITNLYVVTKIQIKNARSRQIELCRLFPGSERVYPALGYQYEHDGMYPNPILHWHQFKKSLLEQHRIQKVITTVQDPRTRRNKKTVCYQLLNGYTEEQFIADNLANFNSRLYKQ